MIGLQYAFFAFFGFPHERVIENNTFSVSVRKPEYRKECRERHLLKAISKKRQYTEAFGMNGSRLSLQIMILLLAYKRMR